MTPFQRYYRRPAVIVDVDGTLINVTDALPKLFTLTPEGEKDFDAFHQASLECPPYPEALAYCEEHFRRGETIVILTARQEQWRDVTLKALNQHMTVPFDGPFMRANGDKRPDDQIKREIYHYLSLTYDIRGALDDSPRVINMWRQLGIPVEVAPGHQNWLDGDAKPEPGERADSQLA